MAFLLTNLLKYRNSIAVNVLDDDEDYERLAQKRDSLKPEFFRQILDEAIYKTANIDQTDIGEKTNGESTKLTELKYFLKDTNIFDSKPEDLQNPSLNGEKYISYQYKIRGSVKFKQQLKINDTLTAIIALFGLFVAIFVNDVYIDNLRAPNGKIFILETAVSLSTLILVGFLYRHYSLKHQIEKVDSGSSIKHFWKTKKLKWFLLELAINLIHLPPKTNFDFQMSIMDKDITYSALDLFSVFMTTRIYLLCRLYALYSKWTKGTATYACEINECTANTLFAIKAGFKENPYFYLTSTMFIGTLVLGLCVRTVERPFYHNFQADNDELYTSPKYQDFNSAWNVFWLVFVTMATVGFGDYYPITIFGRILIAIAALAGIFNTSLVVYTLALSSSLDDSETKAFEVIRKLKEKNNVRNRAAVVVTNCVKIIAFKNILPKPQKEEKLAIANRCLEIALFRFRTAQDARKDTQLSVDQQLKELIENVKLDIKTIKADLIILEEIGEKLTSIEDYNLRIIRKLNQEYSTLLYINQLLDVLKKTKSSKIKDQSVDKEEQEASSPKNNFISKQDQERSPTVTQNNYYETNLIRNIKRVNLKIKTTFSVYDQTHSLQPDQSRVPFQPSTPL